MRLTTLWPDKTLLWKEWKGIATLYALFFGMFTYVSSYTLWRDTQYYKQLMAEGIEFGPYGMAVLGFGSGKAFWVIVFVVALAAVLVGLERSQRTYDLLLAMPYTRGQILHNKFVLGTVLLAAVFVFNALVMTLVTAANPEMPYAFAAADIWAWAGRYVVAAVFTFSFTLLIGTLGGTGLGSGILALIFLGFPLGFVGLITINMDYWLHMYTGAQNWQDMQNMYVVMDRITEWGAWLTVPSYLFPGHPIDQWDANIPLVYGLVLAAALGSYLLAQYAFARNPMERNGEILMFGKLEGIFKAGVAVCFALLIGPVIISGWDLGVNVVAWSAVYLAVGVAFWFAATGVIKWRRREVGGAAPRWGGFGGGSAVVWVGLALLVVAVLFGVRVI